MKEKIISHYENGFSSSPAHLDDEMIDVILKSDCKCDNCGKSIFEMYDFPCVNEHEDGVLCEDCDRDKYYSTCSLCEDSYLCPEKPEDHSFIIASETVKEYGLNTKPGIYKVLRFPVYYGDCLSGFDDLFYDNIQLIKECDINSILDKIYPHTKHEVNMDYICSGCFDRYSKTTSL